MTDPSAVPPLPPAVPPPATNTLALLSLIFGISAWVILPFLGAILAIVLGHLARADLRKLPRTTENDRRGEGLATGGLILGYAQVILSLIGLAVVVFVLHGLALSSHR